jgi:WD40 repeat protein/mono/diheme cytochrome c family protein
MTRAFTLLIALLSVAARCWAAEPAAAAPSASYSQVHSVFAKHCVTCHGGKDPDGELVLESYESLNKGGENGAVIVPGKSEQSVLVQQIEHAKKPFMPPPKKGDKLSAEEIAVIKAWIDAGAPGPKPGEVIAAAPSATLAPKIAPKGSPRRPIQAVAFDPKGNLIAVALPGEVEIRSSDGQEVIRTLGPHHGNVNDLAFSADGTVLAAAAGEPGIAGEARIWDLASGSLIRAFVGHKDAVYSVAVSPDGHLLATGSYDQKITLWDVDTGKPVRDLEGHNAAVVSLSFRKDGKVLASASADRTVKLWDVATGARLDTRSESAKELNAVAFSPDGTLVAAAGVDNRIRIWRVSESAAENTNPLLSSQFAHEGAILRLAWATDGKSIVTSADDRTVKLWDASDPKQIKLQHALPAQPDWPSAVTFGPNNKTLIVGRLDGSLAIYDAQSGKLQPPAKPLKPQPTAFEPAGIERGVTSTIKVTGKDLANLSGVTIVDASLAPRLTVKVLPGQNGPSTHAQIELTASADLPLGPIELTFTGPGGDSMAVKLHVDDLPQLAPDKPNHSPEDATVVSSLPADLWGKFARAGDADYFALDLTKGQPIVVDCAAKRLGSKASVVLALLNPSGRQVATASRFGNDPDALLSYTADAGGRYLLRATESQGTASAEHFYRLSVGSFAFVTGCFPMGVPANADTSVHLMGYNLPPDASAMVKAAAPGNLAVPLNTGSSRFLSSGREGAAAGHIPGEAVSRSTGGGNEATTPNSGFRSRGPIEVVVSETPELIEAEPNDTPDHAMKLPVPASVSGRIDAGKDGKPDVDLYRFSALVGRKYVIETLAARRGSPVDTRVEVLHLDGSPVERMQLAAVRDSYINFRAIDANVNGARFQNWEEMQLNQYMYMSGEVARLFLAPRGPDSDFNFYTATGAGAGKRKCYFDTTATSHALDEKCYIVEPHPPGEKLPDSGLPVFKLNYVNDDACDRDLGSDSRLYFDAPADGDYLVRVTDSRSFGGEHFVYRLNVRPAKPDFTVSADIGGPVPAGSGKSFTARASRIDGFEGPIRVDISGAPAGFVVSSPLVIEAGHDEAMGTIFATSGAAAPAAEASLQATATANAEGSAIARPVTGIGKLTLGPKPPLLVWLEPIGPDPTTQPTTGPAPDASLAPPAATLTLTPGQLLPALLKIDRNGQTGPVEFDVEDLPHGVIVADIGLNGVLIPDGQAERRIFLQCAPWVADTDRPCFARARQAGNPTSPPIVLRVRRP